MDWLFVIGISLEISGATLIAGEVLFASDIDVFARGKSFYGESPSKEAERGAVFTYTGFGLLAVGFVLQLVGDVIDAQDNRLILVAPLTVIAATSAGAWLAMHPIRRWLLAKAERGKHEHERNIERAQAEQID